MPDVIARQLFIVSRETPYLVEYMRQQFGDEPGVMVLLDRRQGRDRRNSSRPVDVERRAGKRRQRPTVDQQIKQAFHALVTAS